MADDVNANVVLTADTAQYTSSMSQASAQTNQLGSSVDTLSNKLERLTKTAGKIGLGIGAADVATITGAVAAYGRYEQQMVSLKTQAAALTSTMSGQRAMMRQYSEDVNKLRSDFGQTTSAAAGMVQTITKLSDQTSSVRTLAHTFGELGEATGESGQNLASGLLQLQKTMGTAQRDTKTYANELVALKATADTSAGAILNFAQSIAPVGRAANISQTDLLGFSTAFIKAGQDGYTAANVFNRVMADITKSVKTGSPVLAQYAAIAGTTTSAFSKMSGTDQFLAFLSGINERGSNAISTLNRLGLDGSRTLRPLLSFAQQSGLSQSIQDARGADPQALARASSAANDTLSMELSKLNQNVHEMSEAIGSAFAGPAKVFLDFMVHATKAVSDFANSPLGKVSAWVIGVGGGFAAMAGSVLLAAGALTKFASAMWLLRSTPSQGLRAGFTGVESSVAETATGPFARRAYAGGRYAGQGLRMLVPGSVAGESFASRLGGYGLSGVGRTAEFMGSALYTSATRAPSLFGRTPAGMPPGMGGYDDVSVRGQMFSSPLFAGTRARMRAGGLQYVSDRATRQAEMAPVGAGGMTAAYNAAKAAQNAQQAERAAAGLAAAGRESTVLARGLATATKGVGGFGMMLASTAQTAGTMAGRGIGMAAGGIGSFMMSNPLMMAMLAGPLAFSAIKSAGAYSLGGDQKNYAGGLGAYYSAAGIQAPPSVTTTSASRTQAGTGRLTINDAMNISQADNARATAGGYKLTNTALRGMTAKQAASWVSTQWPSLSKSPEAINKIALDLTNQFNESTAQQILNSLNEGTAAPITTFATDAGKAKAGFGRSLWTSFQQNGLSPNALVGAFRGTSDTGAVNENLGRFFGSLQDQYEQTASTQGYGAANRQRGRSLSAGYSAYRRNMRSGSQNAAERRFATGLFGLNKSQLDDLNLSTISNPFGTTAQAGRSSTLSGYIRDEFTSGYLSGNSERAKRLREQALSSQGLDTDLTGNRAAKEFTKALMEGTKATKDQTKSQADMVKSISESAFGKGGVLGNSAVANALQKTDDPNAQYQGINTILNSINRRTGGNQARTQRQILGLMSEGQGVGDLGADLFSGAYQEQQRRQGYQLATASRQQVFQTQFSNFRNAANTTISQGFTQQDQEALEDQFGQYMTGQLQMFQQLLMQQKQFDISRARAQEDYGIQVAQQRQDYNLSRKRSEEDYDLQRRRSQADFNLSRKRQEDDYQLSRNRAEADHLHQVQLMTMQAAKSMYNIYQRTNVQSTSSASYLLFNAQDQLKRMQTQESDLNKVRQMGLSDQSIQQLGLTDANNQQELANLVQQMQNNPQIVQQMNEAIAKRMTAAKALVTDQSSQDWQEFNYQYETAMQRGEEDFQKSMTRSEKDYQKSLSRQNTDYQKSLNRQAADFEKMMGRQASAYKRQMDRAAQDLAESSAEISGNMEQILEQAASKLTGNAQTQAQTILTTFDNLKSSTDPKAVAIMSSLAEIFGIDYTAPKGNGGGKGTAMNNQSHATAVHENMNIFKAEGGILPGYTPGRDVHTFSNGSTNIHLSGGEAIMRPEWVRAVGREQIDKWNHDAKHGSAFAEGGIVQRMHGALDFAKKQVGKPYIWGSAGPGGYDCSGFMSAITNYIRNQYPYARVGATASFPWPGFKPGPGEFTIGSTKRYPGSSVGHMAGTLLGVNVESRGGHGPIVGPDARGYNDKGFDTVYHLGADGDFGTMGIGSGLTLKDILKDRYAKLENVLAKQNAYGGLPDKSMSHIINRAARAKYRSLVKKYGDPTMMLANAPQGADQGVGDVASSFQHNEDIVKSMSARMGWGAQWNALYKLVMSESGFNNMAQNPTSTAFGMFQFLDSTWKGYGPKTADPRLQSKYGLEYVKNRYHDPNGAWAFHRAHNWYGDGAIFQGSQTIGVGDRGPEMVLPLNDRGVDFLNDLMSKYGPGLKSKQLNTANSVAKSANSATLVHQYQIDRSTNFTGAIHVTAQNPNEMIAKLQARQRVQALSQPQLSGSRS